MPSNQFNREIRAAGARYSLRAAEMIKASAPLAPCPYPRHRGADWRLTTGGPVTCGVCHPPAPGIEADAA